MMRKRLGFLILGLVVLTTCSSPQQVPSYREIPFTEQPKNIILLIGDGMGLSQISAAMYSNKNRLNLEYFPVVGFHKSYAYNDLVTDSAAGATAFACGVKTYNSAIGMTRDTLPCTNILEEAEAKGLATGLVATATIVHATPAAFIAHQPLRVQYEEIATDMLDVEVDLLIGGGMQYFTRRESDRRNLVKEFKNKGYEVYSYLDRDLAQLPFNTRANLLYFTADKHPVPVAAGRDYLSFAARLSPYFLEKRSDQGFFLMIEGSQIDWMCHSNDAQGAIKETLDFDRAVGEALDYARESGNTLVIVTADHETGGLALNPGSKMGKIDGAFTTNGHTATLIPVFAFGPGSDLFSGIYENTDIHQKMRQALGFEASTALQETDR